MEEKALEVGQVGINSLDQIAKNDPMLGLILVILIVLIIVLGLLIWKIYTSNNKKLTELYSKLDEKNDKLYAEAKADLSLVLSFEQKLDMYLEKDRLAYSDIKEIKSLAKEIKTYLEFIHKK